MPENSNKVNSEQAQASLDSIKDLQSMSLEQAKPPKWVGIMIATIVGLLVFLISAGLRDYYVLPIVALPIVLYIQRNKQGATIKHQTKGMTTVIALCGVAVFMAALVIAAIFLRQKFGGIMAPVSAGVIAWFTIFYLSMSERKSIQKRISGE